MSQMTQHRDHLQICGNKDFDLVLEMIHDIKAKYSLDILKSMQVFSLRNYAPCKLIFWPVFAMF
jgi:hypothetical protein